MPSNAFQNFRDHHLVDVKRLLKSHQTLGPTGRGRRGLGHLTRGGILLLCGAWEVYAEDVLIESVKTLCSRTEKPSGLPKLVQQKLARQVKGARHELEVWRFAGEGWKEVYEEYARKAARQLNTPNSERLNALFSDYLGVPSLSHEWSVGSTTIDKFVEQRGQVAHRGSAARYITVGNLRNHLASINQTAIDTDNYLRDYLKTNGDGRVPWYRTTG